MPTSAISLMALNNEFGFDYLRDNMAFSLEDKVQRGLHYAIVDEVDSILIDEARTPLIIQARSMKIPICIKSLTNLPSSLRRVKRLKMKRPRSSVTS